MKKCYVCKAELPFDRFGRNRAKPDGLASECLFCKRSTRNTEKDRELKRMPKHAERAREYNRQYIASNYETVKAKAKEYRDKNREVLRVKSRERKARRRGAAGSYTTAQWQQKLEYFGGRCYLCAAELKETGVQIEHRIPIARGGTNWPANLAPACPGCNRSKNALTEREYRTKKAVKWLTSGGLRTVLEASRTVLEKYS